MKTAIAYALVIIPISTFVVTLSVLLGILLFGRLLAFIPDNKRGIPVAFLCGILGELAGFGYAFLVFRLLVGPDSFSLLPVCLAAIPLVVPPINDLGKARKVARKLASESVDTDSDIVSQEIAPMIASLKAGGIGEICGFIAGVVVFGIIL